MRKHRLSPYFSLVVAFAWASLPLLSLRFPQGHDWFFELVRVAQFQSALLDGQFPPYWGEELYWGFGSPVFLFYAPLYCLVAALCSFAAGSVLWGSSLALLLFTALGLLSMYLLVAEALGEGRAGSAAAARFAACCYVLNPYLLGDKLLRNADAEYAALCTLPLALYGLLLIARRQRLGALVLAAGLALTVLAHNLTGLVAFALIPAMAAVIYPPGRWDHLRAVGSGMALALGLSAFFWLPALFYRPLMRMGELTCGKFDFHDNFPPLHAIFTGTFPSIGVLLPLLLLVLWLPSYRGSTPGHRVYAAALSAAACFLLLLARVSTPLWESLPFLPLFQFPWRMMGPLALTASLASAISLGWAFEGSWRSTMAARELVLLLLCLLLAAPVLLASKAVPAPLSSSLTRQLERRQIALRGSPATVGDEYLPVSADLVSAAAAAPAEVSGAPPVATNVILRSGTRTVIDAKADLPAVLTFRRWNFAGWRCTVNGAETKPLANRRGVLQVAVPAGESRVEIRLLPPPLRRAGIWISVVSGVLFGVAALGCRKGNPAGAG
jgi:hypothetical protein